MREFGPVATHRAVGKPGTRLLSGCGPLQALLASEPIYPLVGHQPDQTAQQAVGHEPVPADVFGGDLAEITPEFGLLQIDDLAAMVLGAALLTHDATHKPL